MDNEVIEYEYLSQKGSRRVTNRANCLNMEAKAIFIVQN